MMPAYSNWLAAKSWTKVTELGERLQPVPRAQHPGDEHDADQDERDARGAAAIAAAVPDVVTRQQQPANRKREDDQKEPEADDAPAGLSWRLFAWTPGPRPDDLEKRRPAAIACRFNPQRDVGTTRHRPFPRLALVGVAVGNPL